MNTLARPVALPVPRLPQPIRIVLLGSGAAVLDVAAAWLYWHAANGAEFAAILHSIASWVIGPGAARAGGTGMAFAAMAGYAAFVCGLVAVFAAIGRRSRTVARHRWATGVLFGALAYLVVFEAALPQWSATPLPASPWDWRLTCLLAYALFIGGACALAVRVPRR